MLISKFHPSIFFTDKNFNQTFWVLLFFLPPVGRYHLTLLYLPPLLSFFPIVCVDYYLLIVRGVEFPHLHKFNESCSLWMFLVSRGGFLLNLLPSYSFFPAVTYIGKKRAALDSRRCWLRINYHDRNVRQNVDRKIFKVEIHITIQERRVYDA